MHTSFVNKNMYPFKQRDKRLDERCVRNTQNRGKCFLGGVNTIAKTKFQEIVETTLYPIPVRAAK